ncbi:MAG: MATE family efflux transporter [Acetatifactor sp.]|nr:MATE family efflux transporter [Acetatifactor sp.]
MQNDLTKGNLFQNMLKFSLPYLLSCFLQTFYGLADLFITGQFNGADTITAVSVGSQITHMLTVIIVGLAMGTTVTVGHSVGAGDQKRTAKVIGNTVVLFAGFSVAFMLVLLLAKNGIIAAISTPAEAVRETGIYLMVCFLGVPFITAYNVISSIFRGLGDSKTPMYFVAIAGVINVILDYILIGPCGMGALGAACATVFAQGCSVLFALVAITKKRLGDIKLTKDDFTPEKELIREIVGVGLPIACQDGLIQVSFLVITAIANGRGVEVAAAVGIVEKIICFIFLVPSSMLSTVSALSAINAGAGEHKRAKQVLFYGIGICLVFGAIVAVAFQFCSSQVISLFVQEEPEVVRLGTQYLKAYIFDCGFAGVHFCYSGFFCAYGKSGYSFLHNMISIIIFRIPGAYLASVKFPETLFPMGLAAPAGSLASAIICTALFVYINKKIIETKG